MNDDVLPPLPEVEFEGRTLRLGTLLPPMGKPRTMAPLVSAPGFRAWTRVEIEDAVRRKPIKRRHQFAGKNWIVNQANRGSCNAAALTGALRRAMALAGRNDVPHLSWEFGYAQINGGRDQGSMLDDGMQEVILGTGLPPLDLARHPLNKHILKSQYSAEDYRDALNWKGEQCYTVDTPEELATLVLSGQGAAVVAVHVGSSFTRMDKDGYAGADRGAGNHAVGVCDVEIINGRLAFDHFGSWDVTMHADGYAYFDWDRHLAPCNQYHDFYAIVAASNPGDGAPVAN